MSMKYFSEELARIFSALHVYKESPLLKEMRERKEPLSGVEKEDAKRAKTTLTEIRRLAGELEANVSIGLEPGGPYGKWK